jgi:hypothetical protein
LKRNNGEKGEGDKDTKVYKQPELHVSEIVCIILPPPKVALLQFVDDSEEKGRWGI